VSNQLSFDPMIRLLFNRFQITSLQTCFENTQLYKSFIGNQAQPSINLLYNKVAVVASPRGKATLGYGSGRFDINQAR